MATGNQLIAAASANQIISDRTTLLQCIVWLLQQQNGNTMTGNQLIAAMEGQQVAQITDATTLLQVIAFLLSNGGGGSSGGLFTPAAYGVGAAPTTTPAATFTFTVNTSDNTIWAWLNGQWKPTGLSL